MCAEWNSRTSIEPMSYGLDGTNRLSCPSKSYFGQIGSHVSNDTLEQLVHMLIVKVARNIITHTAFGIDELIPQDMMCKVW